MDLITTTEALAAFCARAETQPFVTVDTEFLRERTYYAQLCLVQIALPEEAEGEGPEAILVDTLAPGLSRAPLYQLFQNPNVVKVFHAARQDLEIFFVDSGTLPAPLFDTQIAAMVCGFGEQVGYETLVRRIVNRRIDKSSRFTDWSQRPLSKKQMHYALEDVTHLRDIYLRLSGELSATGRHAWVEQEMATLASPETYRTDPEDAWRRVKTRSSSRRFLAIVKELAKQREHLAQTRDVPRTRIIKDDALLEVAAARPSTPEALGKLRLLQKEARRHEVAAILLEAVALAEALPEEALPSLPQAPERKPGSEALAELLRVLLKARADEAGVAQRLIATSAELDRLATEDAPDLPALTGWRREVFGNDALRLKRGELALRATEAGVRTLEITPGMVAETA